MNGLNVRKGCTPELAQSYISDFACNAESEAASTLGDKYGYYLEDARQSFPSGHSSTAFFAAM